MRSFVYLYYINFRTSLQAVFLRNLLYLRRNEPVNYGRKHRVYARFQKVEGEYCGNEHFEHDIPCGAHEMRGDEHICNAHYSDHGYGTGDQRDYYADIVFSVFMGDKTAYNNICSRCDNMHENAVYAALRADGHTLYKRHDNGHPKPPPGAEEQGADEDRNICRIVFQKRRSGEEREVDKSYKDYRYRGKNAH